jgi:anthranilate phosphoribosyltransferase
VFSEAWLEPLTQVLKELGSHKIWTVHGSDGLDEMTTTGPTFVAALENGAIRRFTVTPEEVGLPTARLEDLKGADPAHNAAQLRAVLDGARIPYRDVALLNAAAALVVADEAGNLRDGLDRASRALDSGAAKATLDHLVGASNT